MPNFLVRVDTFCIWIDEAVSIGQYDWKCLIGGEEICYQVKKMASLDKMPKHGLERANQAVVDHALNYAKGKPIHWQIRGNMPKKLSKKQEEIQKHMKELF
jgi:hypothetical protein